MRMKNNNGLKRRLNYKIKLNLLKIWLNSYNLNQNNKYQNNHLVEIYYIFICNCKNNSLLYMVALDQEKQL